MIEKLEYLFFPRKGNNHRPKILHLSSLATLIIFIAVFQLGLAFITQVSPGVLGDIANLSPKKIVQLTNEKRRKKGLPSLEVDPLLVEAAKAKAGDMFTLDYWAHNSPQGKRPWWFINNSGYSYVYAGENLARDFGDADSIVQAWMNSPTHRENILNKNYQDIGIAVVDGTLNGRKTTLVVEMFGKQSVPVTEIADQQQAESAKKAEVSGESTGTEVEQAKGKEEGISEETGDEQLEPIEEQGLEESLRDPQVFLSQAKKSNINSTAGSFISSFLLTKEFSLILIGIVLLALIIDVGFMTDKNIVRISGKSFVHLLFFAMILVIIWFSSQGRIL